MQQSKRMSMNECNEAMMMLKQKHEAELAFIGARQHEEMSQLIRLIACNEKETLTLTLTLNLHTMKPFHRIKTTMRSPARPLGR